MDVTAARRWQARSHAASPWLHEEVASRMAERLAWFREPPASWLHWEPVAGGLEAHRKVAEQLPQARCWVAASRVDESLKALAGPAKALWHPSRWARGRGPLAVASDTQVDMVWANMALHHEPLPQTLLRRWHQHVAVDGFLMFSCLGPDSLRELREVFRHAGWPEPAHAFTDMHDWGDMLVHSGFAEPVMDMERIVLTYSGAAALLADLRQLGRNLQPARFQGLRGRAWQTRLHEALEANLPRTPEGRLQLTFEIIYGHAFKPKPRLPVQSEQQVSVEDMRAMLRSPRR
jgi:malonyl-CoA O-methyltransferase